MLKSQSKRLIALSCILFVFFGGINCQFVENLLKSDNSSKFRNLEFPAKDQFLGTSPQGGSIPIVIWNIDNQPWCTKECLGYNENGREGSPCGIGKAKVCCNGAQNCVNKGTYLSCQDKIKEFFCYF